MKAIQSFVLTAIALATSACASNAARQQSAAVSSEVQSASSPLAASSIEMLQPTTRTETLPPQTENLPAHLPSRDGHADVSATGANSQAPRNKPSAQTSVDSAHSAATMMPAEQDAEDLYGMPPVRDPWEGFNRKMHGFNNILDRFVLRPVAAGYDKVIPDSVQSGVSRFFTNLRWPASAGLRKQAEQQSGEVGAARMC